MKRAVVTIACGPVFEKMGLLAHPTMAAYARKLGADFFIWRDYEGHIIPAYKKLDLRHVLAEYDRVLYLDTDVIVREDAPDVFEVVPEDHMGMFDEGQYCKRNMGQRNHGVVTAMVESGYDPTLWDGKYYNAGIMVLSRCHQNVLAPPAFEKDHFMDQSYLNAMIAGTGAKVFSLPRWFNRMGPIDSLYGEERFDSYFLHYAGLSFLTSHENLLLVMEHDLNVWRQARGKYVFPRHVAFVVEGGLSEQICAEPTIRFARDVAFQGDEIAIISTCPEIFAHLNLPIHDEAQKLWDVNQIRRCFTKSKLEEYVPTKLARDRLHGINSASLHALGIELPLAYRAPQLAIDAGARMLIASKLQPHDPAQLILVHPGRGAPADTFPPRVWQSYIDRIAAAGYRVALIGNRTGEVCPVVELDTSRCIDLVDRLSVAEMIALVSQAALLIASESSPIYMAAAFDRWIGLICPSRYPEFVLPARQGSPFWRARALERVERYTTAIDRDVPLDPGDLRTLEECLPTPEVVLQFVQFVASGPES